MPNSSKNKGNSYERELVNSAKEHGLDAKRAYASNGEALGEVKEVDLMVGSYKIQAKRRKSLASFLKPTDGVDVVAFREDRGKTYILMEWEEWLKLLPKPMSS